MHLLCNFLDFLVLIFSRGNFELSQGNRPFSVSVATLQLSNGMATVCGFDTQTIPGTIPIRRLKYVLLQHGDVSKGEPAFLHSGVIFNSKPLFVLQFLRLVYSYYMMLKKMD